MANIQDLIKVMKEKARKKIRTVVVAEGWDERCLKASAEILKEGLAKLILLGDEKKIKEEAKKFNADISKAKIINPETSELKEQLAKDLYELRKYKGMTEEKAKELLKDVNYFGCMLVEKGHADGLAGSAICPTAELMRPALQILKTKKDATLISEVCICNDAKNNRVLFFSDASLNVDPDGEQLAQIAVNGADCAASFGFKPKVAMLSYSTKGSGGTSPVIEKTLKALEIAQKKRPDFIFEGEMQGDAALNPNAAKRKCPGAKIMGDANVLIWPNLTASNTSLHLLGQISDMGLDLTAMMGIKKPVAILGRSTELSTVQNLITVVAMEANVDDGIA